MSSLWCVCCSKSLSQEKSIDRGMGPVCLRRFKALMELISNGDVVDLPFDPQAMDIHCRRDPDGTLHFNIYQVFRHHSPSGMEWGYNGSGPADFALNVMELFMRDTQEKQTIPVWDGQDVSYTGYKLHQDFKDKFIAALPKAGGTIEGNAIREWICEKTGGRYFFS